MLPNPYTYAQRVESSTLATPHTDAVVKRFLQWLETQGITVTKSVRTYETLEVITPTVTVVFRLTELSGNEGYYWGKDARRDCNIWEMHVNGTWYKMKPKQITIGGDDTPEDKEARRAKRLQRGRPPKK